VDDSGAIGLDLAAVFEAPTVVASSFVVFDTVYIKPGTVSGDIVGQSSGINNLVANFEYNAGPKFFHAFAVDSLLDKNPLTILGDSSLSSAVVSLDLSASGVATGGSSTITVTSLINTTTKEIEQIPDSGVYVYIIGSNRTTGSATALSGKYDYQYAQVFPVSRVVAGSLTNVIQHATTNEWTLNARVTYLAGKKQSLYGPTQGLSVYGVFDTDAVSFERVGLGGVSWVSTIKTPQWVAGDYKIQGPGTALAVSESGEGSKFATLKGAGMTNVIKFSTDWTFAYWVKHIGATGVGSNESPNFGGLSVQAGQVHVRVQRQSATRFRVFSPTMGASVSHTLATGLTTNLWNHIAVTWTAGTKTLNYLVNNVLAATHVNTDVTRTTFGAEFSLAIAEAITNTQTGVYFDDLRIYNRVLTSDEFLALNDIQNYFHTFGTVLPVESRDALVHQMKAASVTAIETSVKNYNVNTTFRNQPMKYVLDKTGAKFPATTVNYVHAHAIASGATQKPELFDADKLGVVSVLKPASNEMPHLTIPNSYWSRFYKQSYADGAAFSSVANIDSVYAPVAFTKDVDLTNVKDFFTAHRTVLANSNAERYAVKQLEETVLTQAYANVDDPTDTVAITEDGEYQVVIVGKDVDGNVGVGLLETETPTTFNKTLVYGTSQHGALGIDSLYLGTTNVTSELTLSDQLSNLPSGQKISAIYTSIHNRFNIFETVDVSGNKSYYCMGYSEYSILSYITNTTSVPRATTIVNTLTYCTHLTEFVNIIIRADGDDVKALCIGKRNMFIHTTQGKVYGLGFNNWKQLANGNNTTTQTTFVECSDIVTEKTNNNAEVLFVLPNSQNVMVIFNNKTTGQQYAKGWGYNVANHMWGSFTSAWYVDCTIFNNYVADNTYEAIDAYSPNMEQQTVIRFKKVADGTTEYRYSGYSGIHAGSSNGSSNQLNQPCDLINSWITANPSDEFVCSYHNGSSAYGTNMFIRHNNDDDSKRFFAVGQTLETIGANYTSVTELDYLNYTPGDAKYTIDGVTYDPVYFWPGATGYFIGLSLPPASFPAISTLNTTITTAEFESVTKELQMTSEVVASNTKGANTTFKAFATTQQGLTPDQVRDLINDPVNAAAVYQNGDFSAGAAAVTVPKVMDLTGAVYDSSAVNYAHVYLYGTDGVNERHDALSYASIAAGDNLPHLTIPNAYWSRFYKQSYADGAAFSSVANIDSVYAPIAFTKDVDLSDAANVVAFIEAHGTFVSGPERYAVGTIDETVLTQAYANITDHTVTEPIVENGEYYIVIAAEDATGNVGVEILKQVGTIKSYDINIINPTPTLLWSAPANDEPLTYLFDNFVVKSTLGYTVTIMSIDGTILSKYMSTLATYYKSLFLLSFNRTGDNVLYIRKDNWTVYKTTVQYLSQFTTPYYRDLNINPIDVSGMEIIAQFPANTNFSGLNYNSGKSIFVTRRQFPLINDKFAVVCVSVSNVYVVKCYKRNNDGTWIHLNDINTGVAYEASTETINPSVYVFVNTISLFDDTLACRSGSNKCDVYKYTDGTFTLVQNLDFNIVQLTFTNNYIVDFSHGRYTGSDKYAIYRKDKITGLFDTSMPSAVMNHGIVTHHDSYAYWSIIGNYILMHTMQANTSTYYPRIFKLNDDNTLDIIYSGTGTNATVRQLDMNRNGYITLPTGVNSLASVTSTHTTFSFVESSSATLSALSTLNTTITTAEFNKTLQLSGEVVVSDTEGANTVFKAFATTQQGLTPDQVRDLINDPVNAAAVYNESDFTAGTAVLTIPKVLADNGAVYDSSAVNYAHVYLYGTDGVNAKNDALSYASIVAGDNLPHVDITNVSAVTSGVLTVTGTVFSGFANVTGGVRAAVFDRASFDLVGADQSALASFVNTNGTDLGIISDQYAVGSFTDFSLSTYFSNIDVGYTTGPLVDGANYYGVAVSATDTTGNVGVGLNPLPFGTSLIDYTSLSQVTRDSIGSGWKEIKYLPGGSTTWFPGDDNLKNYGGTEFLFTTGDFSRWLIADQFQVNGEIYNHAPRTIKRSSLLNYPHTRLWINNDNSAPEPWVSLEDFSASIANGTMMYGESNFSDVNVGGIHPTGMYVFVR
jgi:hypothetical protein